ncbi:MAG TPA: hypothetical protein VHD33_02955, partial [Legionellaceae bacterium]|nr:hypothetical protein [Legionellaceae bacterium]
MPYFRDLNLLTIENVIEQLQLNEEHPAKTFYEKIGLFLEQVGEDLSDSAHYSDAQFITIFLRIRSILQQIKTIYHVQIHKEKKTRLKEAVLLENNGQVDAQQKMYQTLTAEEQMFDDLVNLKTKALTFILNHISIERIPALIKTIQHSMIASINSLLQLKDMKAYQEMRSGLADSTRQKILAEHMAKYYLNWVSSPEQFYQFIKISNQHHFLSVDLDMLVKQPEFFLSIEDFEAILEHLSQDEQLIPPQCTMDFRQAVLTENAVVIACKNEFILRFFSTVLKNVVSIDQLKSLLTNVTTYQSTDALRDLSAQLPFEYINTIDDFLTIFSIYPHSNKIHLLNKAKSKSFYPALNEQTTIERLVQYFYEGNTNIHQLLYSFLDCFAEETRAYVVHLLFKKVFAEPVQQNVGWIEIPTEESVNQLSQVFRHKKLLVRQKGGGRGALMSNDLYPIDRIYCYEILQKTIHKIIYSECNTRGAVLM